MRACERVGFEENEVKQRHCQILSIRMAIPTRRLRFARLSQVVRPVTVRRLRPRKDTWEAEMRVDTVRSVGCDRETIWSLPIRVDGSFARVGVK